VANSKNVGFLIAGIFLVSVGAFLLSLKAWRKQAVENEQAARSGSVSPTGTGETSAREAPASRQERVEADVEAASALAVIGEHGEAAKSLTRVLSEFPWATMAYAPLAEAFQGLGRAEEARAMRAAAVDREFVEREHIWEIEQRLRSAETRGKSPASLELADLYLSLLRGDAARAKIGELTETFGNDQDDIEVLRAHLDWISGRHDDASKRLERLSGAPWVSEGTRRRELWLRDPARRKAPDEDLVELERRVLDLPWKESAGPRLELAADYAASGRVAEARRQLRLVEKLDPASTVASERLLPLLVEPRWAFERLRVLRFLLARRPDDDSILREIDGLERHWIVR